MEVISCPNCYEDFDYTKSEQHGTDLVPRLLTCGHVVCTTCAFDLTTDGQLCCPTCCEMSDCPSAEELPVPPASPIPSPRVSFERAVTPPVSEAFLDTPRGLSDAEGDGTRDGSWSAGSGCSSPSSGRESNASAGGTGGSHEKTSKGANRWAEYLLETPPVPPPRPAEFLESPDVSGGSSDVLLCLVSDCGQPRAAGAGYFCSAHDDKRKRVSKRSASRMMQSVRGLSSYHLHVDGDQLGKSQVNEMEMPKLDRLTPEILEERFLRQDTLTMGEALFLIDEAIKVLNKDKNILDVAVNSLKRPCHVVGDLHGQFFDLVAMLRQCGGLLAPRAPVLAPKGDAASPRSGSTLRPPGEAADRNRGAIDRDAGSLAGDSQGQKPGRSVRGGGGGGNIFAHVARMFGSSNGEGSSNGSVGSGGGSLGGSSMAERGGAESSTGHQDDEAEAEAQFLFLGDYVDRGAFSCEVLLFLLSLRLHYPGRVHLLRGNHECRSLTTHFGFKDECKAKYGLPVYYRFVRCFEVLPLCAIVTNDRGRYFCTHGGISPDLQHLSQITSLNRKTEPQMSGLLCDLLWSDPADDPAVTAMDELSDADADALLDGNFLFNRLRGCSVSFGCAAALQFLAANNLLCVVRAHAVQEGGYYRHFEGLLRRRGRLPPLPPPSPQASPAAIGGFFKRSKKGERGKGGGSGNINVPVLGLGTTGLPPVMTVFSAPNYCDRYGNKGAVLTIHKNVLEPQVRQYDCAPHPEPLPRHDRSVVHLTALIEACPYMPTSFRDFVRVACRMGRAPPLEGPDPVDDDHIGELRAGIGAGSNAAGNGTDGGGSGEQTPPLPGKGGTGSHNCTPTRKGSLSFSLAETVAAVANADAGGAEPAAVIGAGTAPGSVTQSQGPSLQNTPTRNRRGSSASATAAAAASAATAAAAVTVEAAAAAVAVGMTKHDKYEMQAAHDRINELHPQYLTARIEECEADGLSVRGGGDAVSLGGGIVDAGTTMTVRELREIFDHPNGGSGSSTGGGRGDNGRGGRGGGAGRGGGGRGSRGGGWRPLDMGTPEQPFSRLCRRFEDKAAVQKRGAAAAAAAAARAAAGAGNGGSGVDLRFDADSRVGNICLDIEKRERKSKRSTTGHSAKAKSSIAYDNIKIFEGMSQRQKNDMRDALPRKKQKEPKDSVLAKKYISDIHRRHSESGGGIPPPLSELHNLGGGGGTRNGSPKVRSPSPLASRGESGSAFGGRSASAAPGGRAAATAARGGSSGPDGGGGPVVAAAARQQRQQQRLEGDLRERSATVDVAVMLRSLEDDTAAGTVEQRQQPRQEEEEARGLAAEAAVAVAEKEGEEAGAASRAEATPPSQTNSSIQGLPQEAGSSAEGATSGEGARLAAAASLSPSTSAAGPMEVLPAASQLSEGNGDGAAVSGRGMAFAAAAAVTSAAETVVAGAPAPAEISLAGGGGSSSGGGGGGSGGGSNGGSSAGCGGGGNGRGGVSGRAGSTSPLRAPSASRLMTPIPSLTTSPVRRRGSVSVRRGSVEDEQTFTHAEILGLHLLFSLMDQHGTDVIDAAALEEYATEHDDYAQKREIAACIEAVDVDGDAQIGMMDFICFAARLKNYYEEGLFRLNQEA